MERVRSESRPVGPTLRYGPHVLTAFRKLLVVASGLTLAVVAMTPATAMGAAKGTQLERPLWGIATVTTVINLNTGAAIAQSSGFLSHLGAITGSANEQFALFGSNGFSFTTTGTIVSRRSGDELFTTSSGTGTFGLRYRRRVSSRSPGAPVGSRTPAGRTRTRATAQVSRRPDRRRR
jgi:hypothetical protein